MNKKAELLTENIIFIILNIAFFAILAAFIFIKSSDPSVVEESYAKKIALVLDAAQPGMQIDMDMRSALAKKDKDYSGKIVEIRGNLVTVKLSQKGGYSYSTFSAFPLDKNYFYSSDGNNYSFKVLNLEEVSK